MTNSTNRALSLQVADKNFDVIGVEIQRHNLGYYYSDYQRQRWERPTLTEICRALVKHLAQSD